MLDKALKILFGTKHERDVRRMMPVVSKINSLEPQMKELRDEDFALRTARFRERIQNGEKLDSILPEAFALVREAAWRTLGMRHFDVQMIGGIVLHEGRIAEMKTGEGKTLMGTLAIYLNALTGKGVHVVTVNDYLAKRDAMWMKPLFDLLGVSVGIIQHNMDFSARKEAYNADITYGTNNEYGFDYLRDNMVTDREFRVQRNHYFAIVDEVDSILIDEARTPLIISGPAEENAEKYAAIDRFITKLIEKESRMDPPPPKEVEPGKEEPHVIFGNHYDIDEKSRNVTLTELGVQALEEIMGVENLYAPENVDMVAHIHASLKAHLIFKDEVDYVVREGEVIIVDEHTGRLMEGRRYSNGLHQAIEAKEKVPIKQESQTLASITFQNFFRMYEKLAGMTGTADTEAEEFNKIYGLDVVVIPTNVPVARIDHPDRVYMREADKFRAIVEELRERHANGQPVLVGTVSIEKSELLSQLLSRESISHSVLNAKHHEREAEIVQNAGKPGAITVATNMAGRGTDIVLGGYPLYTKELEKLEDEEDHTVKSFRDALLKKQWDEARNLVSLMPSENKRKTAKEIMDMADLWLQNHIAVKEAGGLHILGTERHESRRIDNQLRGRSGRQGDPGSSRFYLSLEDHLMRIFGGQKIMGIMERMGMSDGQELEARMVDSAIKRAQKRVESHNFDIRKHLLEYDDVMNRQREFVYLERNKILDNDKVRERLWEWAGDVIESRIMEYCESRDTGAWDTESMQEWLRNALNAPVTIDPQQFRTAANPQLELYNFIWNECKKFYEDKIQKVGSENFNYVERRIAMDVIDAKWKEHLYTMDHLRDGVWALSYSEKNPLVEYKIQGFKLFDEMVAAIKEQITEFIFRIQIEGPIEQEERHDTPQRDFGSESHASLESFGSSVSSGTLPGFREVELKRPSGFQTRPSGSPDSESAASHSVSAGGASKRKKSRRR